jgi:GntR family histidine utilization transcriptional repressor
MTAPPRLSWTDVRDVMRARILSRSYALGARLPRDEDIAAELGCTRTTVHRAMQDLEKAGLVERRRKGGTHVKADPITRATLDIPLVRREVEALDCVYSHRLILRELAPCPPDVALRFGHERLGQMLHVRALHMADGAPYALEDRWIDLAAAPEILHVDLTAISANEWLVCHKPYSRVEIALSAINASADIAGQIGCPLGAALLVNIRTTWGDDQPITTVQSIAAAGYQLLAKSLPL